MIGAYPREAEYTKRTFRLLAQDHKHISPSYTRDYDFVVQTGCGREVIDVDGNTYLDFGAGIAVTSTGHCHPKVVKAIQQQAATLIHMSGTDFYYESQSKLAAVLADLVRLDDTMSFFANSGAEAVEAAMKLARYYTGRAGYIAFLGAFHGRTLGALSLTGSKEIQKRHYSPLQPVAHVPYPDCVNCWFGHIEEECAAGGSRCVDYIEEMVLDKIMPAEDCAAIFLEPIQGEGGYIVPPAFWFRDLENLASHYGIMTIYDEIQTGIGRTGKWFAHKHFKDAAPNIITCAKGIASGMPLGVMMASADLMSTWMPGSHASTFGGNPVSCAAALATIEVIADDILLDNANVQGKILGGLLEDLRGSCGVVENPRGLGLMRAVDILGDGLRDRVLVRCFEKGLILLGCGKYGIRFCPGLNVTKEETNVCLNVLEESIRETLKT